MELSDLSSHVSELVDPISYTYHDSFTLHECPPNGQGLTPLIALGILEQMQDLDLIDMEKVEYMGVEYCHALIEALRLAFADTRAFVSDMQHGYVPVQEVLNKVSFFINVLFESRHAVTNECTGVC
jgi:gamma-glutamyltranspeptidase/glutathione hydrolase